MVVFAVSMGHWHPGSNSLVRGSWRARSWSSVGWQSWKRGGYPEQPTCLGPWMLQFCLGPSNHARVRIRVSDFKKYHQANEIFIYRRQLPNCFFKAAHIFTNSDGNKSCRVKNASVSHAVFGVTGLVWFCLSVPTIV